MDVSNKILFQKGRKSKDGDLRNFYINFYVKDGLKGDFTDS